MRGDRELDIMEYRDEMKEWQQSGTLQLPFDVDQLGEEDLLREYRKYSTLMENRDVSEFIVESAENAMTTLEQYGPSYQQDFSGLSFKFSEEKAKFKQLTTKLVRRNLKHVRLPVWLQIGMMCVGMIGGVWMSNYYGRAMMQEAPPEAALPAYDMPPQQPQQAPPRNNRADWNAARRRTM